MLHDTYFHCKEICIVLLKGDSLEIVWVCFQECIHNGFPLKTYCHTFMSVFSNTYLLLKQLFLHIFQLILNRMFCQMFAHDLHFHKMPAIIIIRQNPDDKKCYSLKANLQMKLVHCLSGCSFSAKVYEIRFQFVFG